MDSRTLPRPVLVAVFGVIGLTLAAAGLGSAAGVGTVTTPTAGAVQTRDVRFIQYDDGAVLIQTAMGEPIDALPPGEGGFIRGVLRGLGYERRLHDRDETDPYRLSRYEDGQVLLHDPASGSIVALAAFGRDNAAAFARLLDAPVQEAVR